MRPCNAAGTAAAERRARARPKSPVFHEIEGGAHSLGPLVQGSKDALVCLRLCLTGASCSFVWPVPCIILCLRGARPHSVKRGLLGKPAGAPLDETGACMSSSHADRLTHRITCWWLFAWCRWGNAAMPSPAPPSRTRMAKDGAWPAGGWGYTFVDV